MKLFNRSKQKNSAVNAVTDKLSNLIVRRTIRFQQRWAMFMQRKVERLSVRTKKYLLFLFSVLAFLFCTWVIASALLKPSSRPFSITCIRMPQTLKEKKLQPILEKEFQKIERYKKYMDSCGLPIRPGLKDSIQQLEVIYRTTK